jgi:hypothetical protein
MWLMIRIVRGTNSGASPASAASPGVLRTRWLAIERTSAALLRSQHFGHAAGDNRVLAADDL